MSQDTYSMIADQWARKRSSGKHYTHDYLEKPAFFDEIGDVNGKSILNLGCGSGEECWLHLNQGATYIHGIDISKGLIEHAKYFEPADDRITFEVGDIGKMNFDTYMPVDGYDIVVSSLTFHYIEDWQTLFHRIKAVLKDGGRLVFSTHHPIKWGSQSSRSTQGNSFTLGYHKDSKYNSYEIYGDYLGFRPIHDTLLGQMKVTYYNRSISRIFKELAQAGFEVTNILEPTPDLQSKHTPQDFKEVYSRIPLFVIFSAKKLT